MTELIIADPPRAWLRTDGLPLTVYFYGPPTKGIARAHVGGIAHLEWITKYPAGRVNKMEGEYFGSVSKDMGTLRFLRITEEEYAAHKVSSFL